MIEPPDRAALLMLLPKHAVVAEIGVDEGEFSNQIRKITRPKELRLIDCWEYQDRKVYQDHFGTTTSQMRKWQAVLKRFKTHPEVIVHRDYSVPAAQDFTDEYFDWIYLDANHTYEAVTEDLKVWWPKVKSGGLFLGHDWCKAELRPHFGVVQAVIEFMHSNSLFLEYLTKETGDFGFRTWGIRRP